MMGGQDIKTWRVPRHPSPDFRSTVKRWLDESPAIQGPPKDEDDEDGPRMIRQLRDLERKLRPVEWLAQCVWHDSGMEGLLDFDDLYEMVGPLDVVAFVSPNADDCDNHLNLRSKLDELLSRLLETSEIQDQLHQFMEPSTLGHSPPFSSTVKLTRSVWALLIGIDAYAQSPLRCAVADANAMHTFLTDNLAVPPDHITTLLARIGDKDKTSSHYASRRNILANLWSLRTDERITHGDYILVFYSGHGSAYSAGGVLRSGVRAQEGDRDWNTFYGRGHIDLDALEDHPSGPFLEGIVPADRGELEVDPIYAGSTVPDISDRELNTIFSATRDTKGPNILLIADCCHSASVARGLVQDVTRWRVRSLPPLGRDDMENMLLRAEWNIYQHGIETERSVLDDKWTPDVSSFVCLAACRKYGTAKEHFKQPYGLFTGVLLDTLGSGTLPQDTTFESLIQRVAEQIKVWQEPVAFGDRKKHRLWFLPS